MWKAIKGFEDLYEVSTEGQVRSKDRFVTNALGKTYRIKGRILKPNKIKNGYLVVYLSNGGIVTAKYIHRLVAEAFVSNPKNLPIVNHDDGNKDNCKASNLVWSTYSDNNQHAYDNGLKKSGEGQYNAKLSEEAVREIRSLGKYTTFENIAAGYGVTKATIRDVLTGRTWRNVS